MDHVKGEDQDSLIRENQQLRERVNQLQAANKELEQFTYIVSHDLQEPLRMISGFMALLQSDSPAETKERKEEYIRFAIEGAHRMKMLIRDLLTYSRVGNTDDDFKEFAVVGVIKDALQVFHQKITNRNARIHVSEMPVIKGIKSLISEIFENLISNALKYTDKPNPDISISYEETPENHIFSVKDNGIGIHPDNFHLIYMPFKRLHSKTEYSGTGIGLAICKKIVEKHAGSLWVESTPGIGSTFKFSIKKS